MKRYRILKREQTYWQINSDGKSINPITRTEYIAQKRFLGFLWWYNFNNIDGWTDGCYETLTEAEHAIKNDRDGCKYNEEIVEEYE
jgi:hypothetical protein